MYPTLGGGSSPAEPTFLSSFHFISTVQLDFSVTFPHSYNCQLYQHPIIIEPTAGLQFSYIGVNDLWNKFYYSYSPKTFTHP